MNQLQCYVLSDDPEESGIVSEDKNDKYDFEDKNTFAQLSRTEFFIGGRPYFPSFQLDKVEEIDLDNYPDVIGEHRGIETDFLSGLFYCRGFHFIVSEKVLHILQSHRCTSFQPYLLDIQHEDGSALSQEYFFLHIVKSDYEKYVDFSASKFVEIDDSHKPIREVSIHDGEELLNLEDNGFSIQGEELVFKNNIMEEHDFLYLYPLWYSKVIISERLKLALEEAGVSGTWVAECGSLFVKD